MNIFDIEDSAIAAQAKFEEWLLVFMRKMFEPEGQMYLRLFYGALTEDEKSVLKMNDPEAFQYMEEQVGVNNVP